MSDRYDRRAAFRAASPEEQQEMLERAIARHSTAAGAKQPDLAEPLTDEELATSIQRDELELAEAIAKRGGLRDGEDVVNLGPGRTAIEGAGGGYVPAITSVDCTPRPRYGESQAKFEARMAGYRRDAGLVQREVDRRNRAAALRVVLADGRVSKWGDVEREVEAGRLQAIAYFSRCVCGFCGVRVQDPEIARREYDAHPCAAASVGQDAVDRAQAHAGKATMPPRRKAVLQPALEEQRNAVPHYAEGEAAGDLIEKPQIDEHVDEAVARFALLELER